MPSVDRIVVNENGASKTLTPDQWKAMPITVRIKLIGAAGATFFAGGTQVPVKTAIQELR